MNTRPPHRADSPPPPKDLGGSGRAGFGWHLAAAAFALPIALPAALAGYAVVAMVALLAGHFSAGWVLAGGGAVGLTTGAVALRAGLAEAAKWQGNGRWADLTALVLGVAWLGANVPFSSERITLFRDPATYANTAVYLMHHPALPIEAHQAVFAGASPPVPLSFGTTGFALLTNPDHLQAQGAHLLPVLLASAGWVGGYHTLFDGNLVIGALALLACYGFGRRVMSCWWALGAAGVLAITLPMLEFSRATYTEPLAMLFVWGGLALLVTAHRTRSLPHFALAGLTFGATAMSRIDGLLTLLAVFAYAAVVLGGAVLRRQRRPVAQLIAFALPAALGAELALRDLQSLASKYYHDLGSDVRQIRLAGVLLLVATVAALVVVAAAGPWSRRRALRGLRTGPRWGFTLLPPVAGGLVVLAMIYLSSRRLWFTGHKYQVGGAATYVEFLQKAAKLPLDGSRTYSELSVTWLVWYVGVVAVIAGILGLGLVTIRVLRTMAPALILGLATWILSASYLFQPNIIPDQIWAVRRLLPVVLPGLLLAGAALLSVVARGKWWGLTAAGLVAATVVAQTGLAGGKLALIRQDAPELPEIEAVCRALPANAAVVVTSDLSNIYLEPVRSFCDVPAAGLSGAATAAGLAGLRTAAARSGKLLFALTSVAGALPGVAATAPPYSAITWRAWNATLTSVPCCAGAPSRRLWLGQVDPTGTTQLVNAAGPGS